MALGQPARIELAPALRCFARMFSNHEAWLMPDRYFFHCCFESCCELQRVWFSKSWHERIVGDHGNRAGAKGNSLQHRVARQRAHRVDLQNWWNYRGNVACHRRTRSHWPLGYTNRLRSGSGMACFPSRFVGHWSEHRGVGRAIKPNNSLFAGESHWQMPARMQFAISA